MPPKEQKCKNPKRKNEATVSTEAVTNSVTGNAPPPSQDIKKQKTREEKKDLVLLFPQPEEEKATSKRKEKAPVKKNSAKESRVSPATSPAEFKKIIETTRNYLVEKGDEWGGEKNKNENLKRGAKVLMQPLSMPWYGDQVNQGLFYQPESIGWREYIRSSKHKIWNKANLKEIKKSELVVKVNSGCAFIKSKLKGGGEAHVGLYPNIFSGIEKSVIYKPSPEKPLPAGIRYDKAIQYKLSLAKYVCDITVKNKELKYVRVKCENNYHPLMVMIDTHAFIETYFGNHKLKLIGKKILVKDVSATKAPTYDKKYLISLSKPFTIFVMHFFIGMLNKTCRHNQVNIDAAMRTSFGYDSPGLADTPDDKNGCFRFNLGLSTPDYAICIYLAIVALDKMFRFLTEPKNGLKKRSCKLAEDELQKYYSEKKEEEKKAEEDNEDDEEDEDDDSDDDAGEEVDDDPLWKIGHITTINDCLVYAFFKIEKRNKPTINHITRRQLALDFINKTAFNDYAGTTESLAAAFGNALNGLFDKMKVKNGKLSTTVPKKQNVYSSKAATFSSAGKKEMPAIDSKKHQQLLNKLDEVLKLTVQQIDLLFDLLDEPVAGDIVAVKGKLVANLTIKNPYLATFLDMVNEFIYYLILKQLENENNQTGKRYTSTTQDGHGSDSDCEDDEIASKKIITHNGMRAILSAPESIRNIIEKKSGEKIQLDTHATYYEVEDAVKITTNLQVNNDQPEVVLRDNNAIVKVFDKPPVASTPVKDQLAQSKVKYWVIDITSSTQEEMTLLIETFKNDPMGLLFLVSSGFKNEQGGSEKNPYGTVRVFAGQKNKKHMEKALERIKETDHGLSALSHHIRYMHKLIGNVPRNQSILKPLEMIPDQIDMELTKADKEEKHPKKAGIKKSKEEDKDADGVEAMEEDEKDRALKPAQSDFSKMDE